MSLCVLGLSYGSHDTGACIIDNGIIIAAVEEERLNRKKRTQDFPALSIGYCLGKHGIYLSDIDYLGIPQHPILLLKKAFIAPTRMRRNAPLSAFCYDLKLIWDILHISRRISRIGLGGLGKKSRIRYVEHHFAHAASAFLVSPFEKAAILTIDGIGELATTTMSIGHENKIERLRTYEFPFSIGKFYGSISRYLGFFGPSKEGIVMGLSAYGDPLRFGPRILELIRFDSETGDNKIDLSYFNLGWFPGTSSKVSNKFIMKFGPARHSAEPIKQIHMDIAAGLQYALELMVCKMLRYLHRITGEFRLCLAGGVALNCVLNGKIRELTPFSEIFIQPASNDGGLALGSALYLCNCILGSPRIPPMTNAYLGPDFSDEDTQKAFVLANIPFRKSNDIPLDVALLLQEGMIVGWFQGRAEIGPRALGSRSILADARDKNMKNNLNFKVKHREWFRPFAPIVTENEFAKYFVLDHPSPFMLEACKVKPETVDLIPAATHIDGTARVQTINESQNPLLYRLIQEYSKLTGISVLLNTSFNGQGEPIVCSPKDAIDCFKKTGIDVLVIGPYIAKKSTDF